MSNILTPAGQRDDPSTHATSEQCHASGAASVLDWAPRNWACDPHVIALLARLRADLFSRLIAGAALTLLHIWVTGEAYVLGWLVLLVVHEVIEGRLVSRIRQHSDQPSARGGQAVVGFLLNLALGSALWAVAAVSFWQDGTLGGAVIGLTVIAGALAHVAILYTAFLIAQIIAGGPLLIGLIAMPTLQVMLGGETSVAAVQVVLGFVVLLAYVLFVGIEAGRTHAMLRESMRAAHAANAAKSRFLAVMSHEIRNPLSAVSGTLDVVAASGLGVDQRRLVEMAHRSVGELTVLLNDILDHSRLEAGKFELHPVEVDVRALVGQTLALFSAVAAAKGIELKARIGADVPAQVVVDGGRLRQILSNFLSNAVKFTHVGSILVDVRYLRGPGAGRLRILVSDTGIGMDARTRAQLFEPFFQGHAGGETSFVGTGLGLSICRGLARAMGGDVGVASQPGLGSHFWVEVALGETAATGSGPRPLRSATAP